MEDSEGLSGSDSNPGTREDGQHPRPSDQPVGAAEAPTPGLESTAPFAIEPDATAVVGAQIGRYSVRQIVGFGGMGLVVAAHDSELGRMVAIKLVAGDDEQSRRRLVREAQAMARLSHQNVVTVHEVIRFGDRAGIVMELVDGDNLAVWRDAKPRGWREIVAAYLQAARGLAAAHRAGLVHRDFKPSNALIDREGVVRVTDFGLVRTTGAEEREARRPSAVQPLAQGSILEMTLTRTGAVMGTPAYMAPEQHIGEAVDARTDQWALACSLYTALHGLRPFAGTSHDELRSAVLGGDIRSEPSETAVPRAIRAAIRRALALRPDDRFATMDDLIAALSPRRRAWQIGAVVAATVMAGSIAAVVAAGGGTEGATCTGLDAPLQAVWNRTRSDALRARFAAAGGQAETTDRVVTALDGQGAQWAAARTSACIEARQGVGSPELLDRRMRCLDQRLAEMSAVVGSLTEADRKVIGGAGDAVDRLHPVSDCQDPRDTVPRPADRRARADIAAAEDVLARGWALHALAQYERAMPLAQQAAEVGERTGWSPLLAGALILRGECEDRLRQHAAALATYERAASVAAQAQDDAAVVEALANRFLVLGEHLGRPGEALEGRRFIELALERAGRPPRLRALWLHYLAIMLHATGKDEDAFAAETEAVAMWRRLVPAGHVNLMDSIETLANIETGRGNFDRAGSLHREVLAARTAARGPDHISLMDTFTNLGVLEAVRDRLPAAIEYWERSAAIARAAGASACGPQHNIGLARFQLGQWRAAARDLREGKSCSERASPGKSTSLGIVTTDLGVTMMALGELDQAADLIDRGTEAMRASGSAAVADSLVQGSRLATLRGDRATARARLAEAKKLGSAEVLLVALADAEAARAETGCRAALPAYERASAAAANGYLVTKSQATTGHAECLVELGSPAKAIALLEPELARLAEVGSDPGAGARARFALARALIATGGDRRRARSLAESARDGFATLGAPGQKRAAEVARWLAGQRE